MISSKISSICAEKQIDILNRIRLKYFWNNRFLTPAEKRKFDKEVKIFIYLIILLWLITTVLIANFCTPTFKYSKLIFNDEWYVIIKSTVKLIFVFNIAFGYYIGNANVCYCVYIILHYYFQMTVLRAYIKQTIKDFGEDGEKSQKEIQLIFKTSIQHFQMLNRLNDKNIFKKSFKFVFQV